MARKRPARRCGARRRDGQQCGNYAIVGGRVCRKHGGAAPQVRAAAQARYAFAQFEAGFNADWARHQERLAAWHQRRCHRAAERLGIALEELTPILLGFAAAEYADVDGIDDAPEYRMDKRRGPRWTR